MFPWAWSHFTSIKQKRCGNLTRSSMKSVVSQLRLRNQWARLGNLVFQAPKAHQVPGVHQDIQAHGADLAGPDTLENRVGLRHIYFFYVWNTHEELCLVIYQPLILIWTGGRGRAGVKGEPGVHVQGSTGMKGFPGLSWWCGSCTLLWAHLWNGFSTLCLQVQEVKPCWEFQAPKVTMVSQDSQEFPDPRDRLERWVHQVYVTAAEAATELHSKQVCAQNCFAEWKTPSLVSIEAIPFF